RPGRALWQRRVQNVVLERRALVGLVGIGLLESLGIVRSAVVGGADGAGEKRAVVVGIVTGKPALVVRLLPELDHELDRVDRLLAVEHHLAVRVDLLATPRPQIRIGERRRVAERVPQRLAERTPLGFELLAGLPEFLPGLRELAALVAD